MGYIFAILSVVSGTVKGFCGKKTSSYTKNTNDAMLFNAIRMVFCTVIGLLISLLSDGVGSLKIHTDDILSIVISGVFSSVFVVT